ncbi:MAG TPA: diguanylate cyclase [Desulfobulbus sp.]|nr:diguanylate cyclase [Desulfobulbus sp.]
MELFQHLPCPAFILEQDFIISRANDAASLLFDHYSFSQENIPLASLCTLDTAHGLREAVFPSKAGEHIKRTITMFNGDPDPITVGACLRVLPDNTVLLLLSEHDRDKGCSPGCRRLRILEEQYQHNPAGILLVNDRMEMISYNRRFLEMWHIPEHIQQSRDENESLQAVLDQLKDPEGFLAQVHELYKHPKQTSTDEIELKDGRFFYRHSFPVYSGEVYHGRVWYFLDITSLKAAQRKIIRQQKFQKAILEHIQDGIIACNARGQLIAYNRASREIHGCDLARVPQGEWANYYQLYQADGETPLKTDEIPLVRAFQGRDVHNQEIVVRSRNGEKRELRVNGQAMYDNDGSKLGAAVSLHDITDLNKARKKLHHLAYHDDLTGLANRRLFHDLLKQDISRAERNRKKTAILFLDLDNFKQINDRYGHQAGDQLLIKLAASLRHRLRESDILCRWGGDEFVIALPEIADSDMACRVAKKICRVIRDDIVDLYKDCGLTMSIGIAVYPDNGTSPDNLIRQADMAMYLAKQKGKNRVCLAPCEPSAEMALMGRGGSCADCR